MGNEAAEHVAAVLSVAEVASAIERVEAGIGEAGCVADVVQQRGSGQQAGVTAEDRGEAAGLGGNPLGVGPAAWQRRFENRAGGGFGPVSYVHALNARRIAADVHGRGGPSGDV